MNDTRGPYGSDRYYYDDYARLEKKELRRNANIVGLSVLLLFGLGFVVAYLLYYWVSAFMPREWLEDSWELTYHAVTLVSYCVSFIVPTALAAFWIRIPSQIAFPMRRPAASILIPGVFLCLGCSIVGGYLTEFVMSAFQQLFGLTPTMPDFNTPTDPVAYAVYFFSIAIAPAFLEEMLFRGVIMQSLRRFGDGFALVMSAALFAMVHGNLVQGPNSLIMGIAIGMIVLRTGSLWSGIVIHFVNNALALGFEAGYNNIDAFPWMENLLNGASFFLYLVGGVAGGLYLLSAYTNIFKLAPSGSRMSFGRRTGVFFSAALIIIAILVTLYITSGYFEPIGA